MEKSKFSTFLYRIYNKKKTSATKQKKDKGLSQLAFFILVTGVAQDRFDCLLVLVEMTFTKC